MIGLSIVLHKWVYLWGPNGMGLNHMGWAPDAKRQCWTDRPLGRTAYDDTPTTQTIIVTYSWSSFWQGSRNDQELSPHGSDTVVGYDYNMTIYYVNKPVWSDQSTVFVRNIMILITIIITIIVLLMDTWMLWHQGNHHRHPPTLLYKLIIKRLYFC